MESDEPTEVVQSFAQNLRFYRLKRGLSQEALAHKADLDRTYVSSCERGRRNATLSTVGRLAEALDVLPEALIRQRAVDS